MQRVTIRELDSPNKVKPRVADVLIDKDNNRVILEVKHDGQKRQVELGSLLNQLFQVLCNK